MARSTSFNRRLVRYEEIHAIEPEDFRAFIDAAGIRARTAVLDCGCGYGAVTREILMATEVARLRGETNLTVDLIDESPVQLSRAKAELSSWREAPGVTLNLIEGVFPDDIPKVRSYDVIVCKMVLHEVNKDGQLAFLEGAHRFLANNGHLLLWELSLSPEIADFFRSVIRRKDQLAGYDTMVERRNFLTSQELTILFMKSPFRRVDLVRDFIYRFDTRRRFTPEFREDEQRFDEWHAFIRQSAAKLPSFLLSQINYSDEGRTIAFDIRRVIAVATRGDDLRGDQEVTAARVAT